MIKIKKAQIGKKEKNGRKKRKEIKLEVTYIRPIFIYINPMKSVL